MSHLTDILPQARSSGDSVLVLNQASAVSIASGAATSLESLTANLAPKVRREVWNGRNWLVVPVRMLQEQVLAGSQGPLFYPQTEISDNPTAWNGIPITLRHPSLDGRPVSARHPSVLENQGLGYVFSANVGKGPLDAEAWFDEDRTREKAPEVHRNITEGRPVEVSTGLYTDNEPAGPGAAHNGRSYAFVARRYRPDHLAVLPDQTGACSVQDGCGLLVGNADGPGKPILIRPVLKKKVPGKRDKDEWHFETAHASTGFGAGGSTSSQASATREEAISKAVEHVKSKLRGTPVGLEGSKLHETMVESGHDPAKSGWLHRDELGRFTRNQAVAANLSQEDVRLADDLVADLIDDGPTVNFWSAAARAAAMRARKAGGRILGAFAQKAKRVALKSIARVKRLPGKLMEAGAKHLEKLADKHAGIEEAHAATPADVAASRARKSGARIKDRVSGRIKKATSQKLATRGGPQGAARPDKRRASRNPSRQVMDAIPVHREDVKPASRASGKSRKARASRIRQARVLSTNALAQLMGIESVALARSVELPVSNRKKCKKSKAEQVANSYPVNCSSCMAAVSENSGMCLACGLLHNALPNQPRSSETGQYKWLNAGTGSGECHHAAQAGHMMLTDLDRELGDEAVLDYADRGENPAGWAVDEGKWEKAKKAAQEGGYTGDHLWAVVAHIYQNMGGKVGKRRGATQNEETENASTMARDSGGKFQAKGAGTAAATEDIEEYRRRLKKPIEPIAPVTPIAPKKPEEPATNANPKGINQYTGGGSTAHVRKQATPASKAHAWSYSALHGSVKNGEAHAAASMAHDLSQEGKHADAAKAHRVAADLHKAQGKMTAASLHLRAAEMHDDAQSATHNAKVTGEQFVKGKRKGEFKSGFKGCVAKFTSEGKPADMAERLCATIARRKGKAPGGKNYKPKATTKNSACCEECRQGRPCKGKTMARNAMGEMLENCGGPGGKPGPCPAGGGRQKSSHYHRAYKLTARAEKLGTAQAHLRAEQAHRIAAEHEPDAFAEHFAQASSHKEAAAAIRSAAGRGASVHNAGYPTACPACGGKVNQQTGKCSGCGMSVAKMSGQPGSMGQGGMGMGMMGVGITDNEYSFLENCGGKGGKPGPCPAGGKGETGGASVKAQSTAAWKKSLKMVGPPEHVQLQFERGTQGRIAAHKKVAAEHAEMARTLSDKARAGAHAEMAKTHRRLAKQLVGNSIYEYDQGADMNRDQMIAYLTTNCSCWKEKGAVLANKEILSDEDLRRLVADARLNQERTAVVNSLRSELELGDGVALNAMPAALAEALAKKGKGPMASKKKKKMDDEEDAADQGDDEEAEGESPTGNQRTLSPEEWLAAAPPQMREVWNSSVKIHDNHKAQVVGKIQQLIANTRSESKKARLTALLESNPTVNQLQAAYDLAAEDAGPANNGFLMPGTTEPALNYGGLGIVPPSGSPDLTPSSQDDHVYTMPTLNFDELARNTSSAEKVRRKA